MDSSAAQDPFQQVYAHMAAKARADVLRKPHDTETWRYERRPPLRFRASEAGSCPRRLWYRLMGYVPTPDDPGLVWKQADGNIGQDMIRTMMKEAGVGLGGIEFQPDGTQKETLDTRRKFVVGDTEVEVSARADGALETPRGLALFEFKTMAFYPSDWLEKTFAKEGEGGVIDRLKKKHPYYVAQMQMTMAIFDYDLTYFGHKNKSAGSHGFRAENDERCGVYLERDQQVIDGILATFAEVQEQVHAGTPPRFSHPKVPLDGSGECGFCAFHYQCYGAQSKGAVIYPE